MWQPGTRGQCIIGAAPGEHSASSTTKAGRLPPQPIALTETNTRRDSAASSKEPATCERRLYEHVSQITRVLPGSKEHPLVSEQWRHSNKSQRERPPVLSAD